MTDRSVSYDDPLYIPSIKVLVIITIASWLAISLFNTGIFVFSYAENSPIYEFFYGVRWTPLYHSPWLLIIPCILWLARKFPLHRNFTFKNLSVHISLAFGIAFLTSLLHTYFIYIRLGEPFQFSSVTGNFLFYSVDRLLIYFVIVSGYYAIDYYWKMSSESIKELRLLESINRQNLNSFKNDIQPGFLLNTIRDIEKILPDKPEYAEKMIADFAQIIRKMLQNSQKAAIRTDDDLYFLNCYIEILADRLHQPITIRDTLTGDDKKRHIAASLSVIRLIEKILSRNPDILRNLENISYEPFSSGNQYGVNIRMDRVDVSPADLQKWFYNIFSGPDISFANSGKMDDKKTETVTISDNGSLFLSVVAPGGLL